MRTWITSPLSHSLLQSTRLFKIMYNPLRLSAMQGVIAEL